MQKGRTGGEARSAWAVVSIAALMTVLGCRSHRVDNGTSESAIQAVRQAGRVDTPEASGKKVASARGAIVSECAKISFGNASRGLIAAEPGLHEDVLDLRDPVSYRVIPFGLNETLRLEALLRQDATPSRHLPYPAQQADCIEKFVAHLQSLTDPLVEADKEQKQLDVSAFNKASKEAEQETEQEQKAMAPAGSSQP